MGTWDNVLDTKPPPYKLLHQLTGEIPSQGWLYLTVNHLAFYSFILGSETRWTDVTAPTCLAWSSPSRM